MNRLYLSFIIVILFLSSSLSQSALINQDFLIDLDCDETNGVIKHYGEINCGPLPNLEHRDGVDLTDQYKEVGINFIRTHDFNGPTDISSIFPDFSKNPFLETSYDFSASDIFINSIIESGAEVFYRLGESASTNESLRQPPTDFKKWAEICRHIVMHYNDGWADGYHYNITYWEIWNEPDLTGFWNGTTDQYYELYQMVTNVLKSHDPSLKIGGPCTSSIYNVNFTTKFLTYLLENDIPLDFFSWHMYAKTPHELFSASQYVRTMLDSYGFTDAENINTEWNYNIIAPQRDKDNAKNAAFTACSLISFLDADMDYCFRYRGTQDNNRFARFIGFDLALFSHLGEYKTPALTYLAFHEIVKDTPLRLDTPIMDSSDGITYLAGISSDESNISILISNFEARNQQYSLTIDDIPWDESYTMVQYVIDDRNHLQMNDQLKSDKEQFTFEDQIKKSTVQFIRLTNTSFVPEEGPPVLEIPFLMKLRILDPIRALFGIILMLIFFG